MEYLLKQETNIQEDRLNSLDPDTNSDYMNNRTMEQWNFVNFPKFKIQKDLSQSFKIVLSLC